MPEMGRLVHNGDGSVRRREGKPVEAKLPVVDVAQPAAVEEPELTAALEHLRDLVGSGSIEEARAFIQELERLWGGSEEVQYWARVLAPPTVRVRHGERGRPRDRERAWLREHAAEYPGSWLALLGDQMVAADPDLGVVLQRIRQTPGAEHALIHFEPTNTE
jgi:hypothetical protein